MRKIALSLVLAGLVATSAVAEVSGVFVGVNVGYGSLDLKASSGEVSASDSLNGGRYGVVAGFKQFFGENFGARLVMIMHAIQRILPK